MQHGEYITRSNPLVREAVYKSFGGKCFYTGTRLVFNNFHIDHFIPTSKNGKDIFSNYVLSSPHINLAKSDLYNPESDSFVAAKYLLENRYGPRSEKLFFAAVKKRTSRTNKKSKSQVRKSNRAKTPKLKIITQKQKGVSTLSIANIKRLLVTERIILKYANSKSDWKRIIFPNSFSVERQEKYIDYIFEHRCFNLGDRFGIRITTGVSHKPNNGVWEFDGGVIRREVLASALVHIARHISKQPIKQKAISLLSSMQLVQEELT